jgi:PAS domain S-box-containing protein
MTQYDNMSRTELIEEIRKKDAQLSFAFELVSASDHAIIGKSLDGTITGWNRGAEKIYGYSAGEIIGRNISILSTPDRHDEVLRILEKTRHGERIENFETLRVMKTGGQINVSMSIYPLVGIDGEITGASAISRDVTKRKRTEEELQFTQFATDRTIDQAFWMTEGGHFFYVNDSACRTLGYSRDELLQMSMSDIGPTFTPEVFARHWRDLRENGSATFESFHRTKDGRVYPVEIRANYVVFDGKEYNCAFATDITERKQMEEQLLLTKFCIDRASITICRTAPDGKILDVNQYMCESLGYTREELTSMSIFEIDPTLTRESWPEHRKKVWVTGTRTFESLHRRKNGSTFPVEVTVNYLTFNDKEIGISFAKDISARKKAEKVLRQSARREIIQNRIAKVFLTVPDEEMYGDVLNIILGELESKLGFFGFIADNGDLVIPSMTGGVWSKCHVPGKSISFPPDTWGESRWGKAIREKKTYFSDGEFSIPEGHLPIDNFLISPIVFGNKTIGLIAAANREGGYTAEDKDLLESIAGSISPILNARLQRDRLERERRRAEIELEQSNDLLRTIIETAPTAIIGLDLDGNVKFVWNPAAEKMLGWSAAEIMGRPLPSVPDGDQEQFRKYRELIRSGKTVDGVEVCRRRRDGTQINYSIHASPLHDARGRITGNIAVLVEITERKRMEEELRQAHDELERRVEERTEQLEKTTDALRASEERYALAVRGSNDGIWDLDLATGKAYHSPRWKAILGYEGDEISDNYNEWESRIHPDDLGRVLEAGKAYQEGRSPSFETEYRIRHKNGYWRWILSRGACLRDSLGKAYRMAGSITDITERKELEQQLLHSQKMESVGILAGGVAHEFNNLLTAISGYGQILQENISADDGLSQESITNVLKAAARAADLTRGLLAFSRKQVISPKPVHIDSLIDSAGKIIRRVIGEDIEFSTGFSGKDLLVKADPAQIEQVLMNMATNARDAMPKGGRLAVTTMRVIVKNGEEAWYDLPDPGKYVRISVADTGMGIDGKTLENIFEPFYTTKDVGKGTGLGLSIAHGIIKQHNGSIQVTSKPGKGTTFDIYLPIFEGHSEMEEPVRPPQPEKGVETLLVAEDEEIVRVFIQRILERSGYKVIVVDNGEEAVARFREHDDISLVLSDVVMPGKNGRDVLCEIRKMKPGIKMIFISGYTADVMSQKGMLEEGTEFIAKPFQKNDLLKKVRDVLDSGLNPV